MLSVTRNIGCVFTGVSLEQEHEATKAELSASWFL